MDDSTLDDATLDAFATWERESWEVRAAAYAERVGRLTTGAISALLDAAAVGAGTRLLDVATGPGFVAEAALARGALVTAVDQSEAMVREFGRRLPGVEVRCAPAESMGLPKASYDAVVAGFLLNHLARPRAVMTQLVRVLVPGGRVAMSVWDVPAANRAMGLVGEVVTALGIRGVIPPGPESTAYADHAAFAGLLEAAGLAQVQVQRTTWTFEAEPGEWFDTVAAAMPRSGAVLAQVDEQQRAEARAEYIERARNAFEGHGDLVVLPTAAVIGSGTRT